MATKVIKKKIPSFLILHKLFAGVALLTFVVIIVAGLRTGLQLSTIAVRSTLAMIVIGVISRVVIRILVTFEEMNSDEG